MSRLASIRQRLGRMMIGWSLVWVVAGSLAVLLTVEHEIDELLDDTLRASAQVMSALLSSHADALPPGLPVQGQIGSLGEERFAWQMVSHDGRVLLRSPSAPAQALHATATAGFSDTPDWRVLGVALAGRGRMLYVAQTRAERHEARLSVGLNAGLAALGVGLLAYLTLGAQIRHELLPLQRLSDRLAHHDPSQPGVSLGPAERAELQPVHAAIDELGHRLARRLAHERVFSAHAAHALRTPLAGIDAQLAVALRESPPELQPRLRRVREASTRLQRVVAALLLLFRNKAKELSREPVDLPALLARLPVAGLQVDVPDGAVFDADADLLAAALLNLLDNAQRHGAHRVVLSLPAPDCLRLHDDGPGVPAEQRDWLRQTLAGAAASAAAEPAGAPSQGQGTGLGLHLAQLVARAHGGQLHLPDVESGFAVELAWPAGDERLLG
ncbi:sensor histidine kinase [Leptothrix cholodnii]|nr:HAMP domain-containing sensor histidine kinase [Leptothrix cholodnii]